MAHRVERRHGETHATPPAGPPLDSPAIDELYGLEPVFDPAKSRRRTALGEFVAVRCPYCAESIDIDVDLTAGPRSYVEDCAVCCHPIELSIRVSVSGRFYGVSVHRIDG